VAELNHFVIAATMGATLGPRIAAQHGQLGSAYAAATISNLLHRRRKFIEDLNPHDDLTKKYEKAVARAFLTVRDGFSSHRVLAAPALNARFIQACRDLGLDDSVFHLNLVLIGLRKHNKLKAKSKRTVVHNQWRYAVASEIAARVMFYRYGASVDTTLAHPKLVEEFDRLASSITPGHCTSRELRTSTRASRASSACPACWNRNCGSRTLTGCRGNTFRCQARAAIIASEWCARWSAGGSRFSTFLAGENKERRDSFHL